jgi:hypothetical protein
MKAVRKGEIEIVQEAIKRGVTSEGKENALIYADIPQTKMGVVNQLQIEKLLS